MHFKIYNEGENVTFQRNLSLFNRTCLVCVCVCRFYFKKVSDEFDCGVVFEEVRDDDAILPIFEEKIIGKVEKVD